MSSLTPGGVLWASRESHRQKKFDGSKVAKKRSVIEVQAQDAGPVLPASRDPVR
jgi:hypothetical protein